MLVHRRVAPSIKVAGTHLYTWVERGTVGVKYLAQEHKTISPARTARSGVELTNHFRTPRHPLFRCSSIHSVRRLYVSVLAPCFRSLFSVTVHSNFFPLLPLFLLDPQTNLPPELHRSLKQRLRSKIPKERTN